MSKALRQNGFLSILLKIIESLKHL